MDYDSAYNEVRRTIERIADELDSQFGRIADKVESLELDCITDVEQRLRSLELEQTLASHEIRSLKCALQLEKNKVTELQATVAGILSAMSRDCR